MSKKKVLGRGLDALMGAPVEPSAVSPQGGGHARYLHIRIDEIRPNRLQPRKEFDPGPLAELADSIREVGVIEPLIVTGTLGGYELIAGERRLRASKMAGLTEVPAVVLDVSDAESLELALIENIQREDLNPLEEATAYQRLMGFGMTQEDVANKVGKPRATVANFLRILKLPPEIRDELGKGTLSMGHAKAILSVEGHGAQRELARRIIQKGLSVREAERLSARPVAGRQAKKGGARQDDASREIEDMLKRSLGTRVTLSDKGGRGNIRIEYYSIEERERLLELLTSLN